MIFFDYDDDLIEISKIVLSSLVVGGVAGYLLKDLVGKNFTESEFGCKFENNEDEKEQGTISSKKDINDFFEKRIIGQPKAIKVVVDKLIRNKAGLCKPNKPKANLLFIGPSGVGKTEMSRAIAEFVKKHEPQCSGFLKIDCSEYNEKHEYSKLIGSPPGYVGSDKEGFLTGFVRKIPNSVILFDEIEKANISLHNLLLQIMDEGVISDNVGKKVDFTNTYIIMTSNVGLKSTDTAKKTVGFKSEAIELNNIEEKMMFIKALKDFFSVEFINRIDDVVVFDRLTKKDIRKIMLKEINDYKGFVNKKGLDFEITDEVLDIINEKSYNIDYGAREIKRMIEKIIITPLAEFITSTKIKISNNTKVMLKSTGKDISFEILELAENK
ncbi:MAG: AAA family ATPase [Candidatus Muirbacterium halophilum]|nr:AAA family ATPase [Candidatus Muirbacterium halophilum]